VTCNNRDKPRKKKPGYINLFVASVAVSAKVIMVAGVTQGHVIARARQYRQQNLDTVNIRRRHSSNVSIYDCDFGVYFKSESSLLRDFYINNTRGYGLKVRGISAFSNSNNNLLPTKEELKILENITQKQIQEIDNKITIDNKGNNIISKIDIKNTSNLNDNEVKVVKTLIDKFNNSNQKLIII
jgi:hypothetical protein